MLLLEDLVQSCVRGLGSGFEPLHPGRQLYQQGLKEARLGCRDRTPPFEGARDPYN